MAKSFDPQIINPILKGVIEEIASKGALVPTKDIEMVAKPIEEYEGRMRVKATDIFDVPVYIAEINFYLNQADMQAHRGARGAMILYMDTEVADKFFKAAGLQVPYDEDDGSMEALCGNLCQSIATTLKDRLTAEGFVPLEISAPAVYKNTIPEGVEFSKDQDEKQEISFYFLKHKAVVVDWTLAPIPKK